MQLHLVLKRKTKQNKTKQGFPGGSVVKNLPANAADVGLILDLGRSHMSGSDTAHEPQLQSLPSRALEPPLLSLHAAGTEA